jgi:phosphopantothenoylcysteine decarboxylase/phosphopantothenate--cysteine ligase
VGFAAETNNVEDYARKKLKKKNADILVANDVSRSDAGFDVDTNKITIFEADGTKTEYPLASKRETADFILDAVLAGLAKRS